MVVWLPGTSRERPKWARPREALTYLSEFFSSPRGQPAAAAPPISLSLRRPPPSYFSLSSRSPYPTKMSAEDLYDGAIGIDLGTTYS